ASPHSPGQHQCLGQLWACSLREVDREHEKSPQVSTVRTSQWRRSCLVHIPLAPPTNQPSDPCLRYPNSVPYIAYNRTSAPLRLRAARKEKSAVSLGRGPIVYFDWKSE